MKLKIHDRQRKTALRTYRSNCHRNLQSSSESSAETNSGFRTRDRNIFSKNTYDTTTLHSTDQPIWRLMFHSTENRSRQTHWLGTKRWMQQNNKKLKLVTAKTHIILNPKMHTNIWNTKSKANKHANVRSWSYLWAYDYAQLLDKHNAARKSSRYLCS